MENIDEQILKELKEDHQELIKQVKITNDKLDKLVEIMEETRAKCTDAVM